VRAQVRAHSFRYLRRAILIGVLYYGAARLGLALALVYGNVSPVWPSSGVAIGLLLLFGLRHLPAVLVASFLSTAATGVPTWTALAIAVGSGLEPAVAVAFLRWSRFRHSMERTRDVLRFAAAVVLLGTPLSATVGMLALAWGGVVDWSDFGRAWPIWWLGNAVGGLALAPLLLVWRRPPTARWWDAHVRELAALLLLLVAACVVFVVGPMAGWASHYPLIYLVFPFSLWAALRLGQHGAVLLATMTAAMAVGAVAVRMDDLAGDAATELLMGLQSFAAVTTLSAMILAARTLERERALAREREARADAERAERRARFLAEAGSTLNRAPGRASTLALVARQAIPLIADCCVINEVVDGRFVVASVAHRDREQEARLRAMRERYSPVDNPNSAVARSLRTGEAELIPEISGAHIQRLAVDADHLRMLRELAISSALILPLNVRGQTIGVMTLMMTDSGRRFGAQDLAWAQEAAARIALSIDHAHLFDEAQRASRAREKVIAVVSHDLRNPLTTILLNATSILEVGRDRIDDWIRNGLHSIVLSAEQINHLVLDLIDITRLESGSLAIDRSPYPAAALVDEAVLMLQPLAREANLRLEGDAPPELPAVMASRDRIRQVYSNLVGNAIRHTPPGGRVSLSARAEGGVVRFCVVDSGSGIPEAQIRSLHEPFWHAPSTYGARAGLGIPITRAIVQAHGGEVEIERLDVGTRVSFTLPLAPPAGDVAVARADAAL
jgi:signal transduction histidine kinase/integral membrane sensor domain MASE1